MNGFGDFVQARQPWILPNQIVGMGNLADFVNAGKWVLPNAIVGLPSSGGNLPKAPDMPKALLGARNGKAAMKALGCGCGGGCGSCGMGTLSSDTIIPQASLPAFLQGDAYIAGFPTVYLAGVALIAAVAMFGNSTSRRRR